MAHIRPDLSILILLASLSLSDILLISEQAKSSLVDEEQQYLNYTNNQRNARFSLSSIWDFSQSSSEQTSSKVINFKCGYRLDAQGNYLARLIHLASGRIVGGREASIRNFPWIVSLQRQREAWFGASNFFHSCGGSLITPSWILTAAHCLYEREEPIRAVAGTDNMDFLYRAQIRDVDRMYYHLDFNIDNYDNDIALIKVNKPFNLDTTFSPISLICLNPNAPVYPYDIASICGFGAKAFRQKSRSHLFSTDIAIIDDATCNKSFSGSITQNMLCAGGMIQNKRDACSGDSGGPLMLQDLDNGHIDQIGIVSFGNDCAVRNYPGIYTKLSRYYEWIVNIIDEPLPSP